MPTLFYLSFMLPTIYVAQVMKMFGSSGAAFSDNYLSDLD
jgi:hypothetical protein